MDIFVNFSIIIVIAAAVAALARVLKQPLIIGHIITGLIVGPQILNIFNSHDTFETFSKFGISILLFIVGIGLSPKVIKTVGKPAVITGGGQVIFTTFFGFLIANFFGYDLVSALYIATALTFSSTIIILKLLSDKKDTQKLYGQISIGFLLVQDIIATLILIFATSFSGSDSIALTLLSSITKVGVLTAILMFITSKILPKMQDFFAKSNEFLFLFSLAWGLGLASLYQVLGFSIEIGALIAGVTLAISPYAKEIESKLKPLRDFFIITFFVLLGAEMSFESVAPVLTQGLVFSLFVLIGNPLIVLILMGILKYNRRTGFMAGLTVAQISEFSLILVLLGVELGHINQQVLSLVTIVGLVTIACSTYLIVYSEKIFSWIGPYLGIFERKNPKDTTLFLGSYEVILFGSHRVGHDFLKLFSELKENFLIVDFNPDIIKSLKNQGFNVLYGDAEDSEFLEEINITEAKIVISTISDYEVNKAILSKFEKDHETIIILLSFDIDDALNLYDNGATYVMMPHFIGSQVVSEMAARHWFDFNAFLKEKNAHIDYLKDKQKIDRRNRQNIK